MNSYIHRQVYAVKAVNDTYLSVNTEMTTEEKNEM